MLNKSLIAFSVGAAGLFLANANANAALIVTNLVTTVSPSSYTVPSDAADFFLASQSPATGIVGGTSQGTYINASGITSFGGYSDGSTGSTQFSNNGGTGPTISYPVGNTDSTIAYTVGTNGGNGTPGTDFLYVPVFVGTTTEHVDIIFGGIIDGGSGSTHTYFLINNTQEADQGTSFFNGSWKFIQYSFDISSTTGETANVELLGFVDDGAHAFSTISVVDVTLPGVPEPASLGLLGLGGIGSLFRRRRTA